MNKSTLIASAAALGLLLLGACDSQASQSVIAQFGDSRVTTEEFYLHLKQMNPQMDYAALPATEQARLLNEYVAQRIYAAAALEEGLDEQAEVAARLKFFRQRVLAEAFRQDFASDIAVLESDARAYYDKNRPLFAVAAKYLIEHLVYKEPEKAIYAQDQLRQGRPYLDLAKHKESDADLTFVERKELAADILLPELRAPVSELAPGEVTELIYTNYGYHVIRLVEKEDATFRPFEDVSDEITARLQQATAGQRLNALVEDEIDNGNVKLYLDHLRSTGGL